MPSHPKTGSPAAHLLARVTNMRAFSHEVHHVHQETHGNALNLFSPWNSVHFEFEVCHRDTRHFNSIYSIKFVFEWSG